jgi:AraC-like DNA-binding protein
LGTSPPLSCEREYSDIEECCAAFRATHLDFLPFARSAAKWRLGTADLGKLTLWWGRVAAHGAGVGAMPTGSLLLVVSAGGARGWRVNRETLTAGRVAVLPPRAEYACILPASSWRALTVPPEVLETLRRAAHEAGLAPRRGVALLELGEGASRVRRALESARRLTTREPSLLDDSGARSALQRALLDALLESIPHAPRAEHADHRLLARLVHYLRMQRGHALWVSDLCSGLATTPRSLHRLFPEALGTTPARYLRLRRLHLARRALLAGDFPSVTAAAVHFGFFDLGRFSSAYRRQFGEMPSAALRRGGPTRVG